MSLINTWVKTMLDDTKTYPIYDRLNGNCFVCKIERSKDYSGNLKTTFWCPTANRGTGLEVTSCPTEIEEKWLRLFSHKKGYLIMIDEDLKEFLESQYDDILIKYDKFGQMAVSRKGAKNVCCFQFRDIDKKTASAADKFIGHTCLAFEWKCLDNQSGGGFMEVADEEDIKPMIIEFVNEHLKVEKRQNATTTGEHFEQLSLFDLL